MAASYSCLLVLALCLAYCQSFSLFQERIPNGDFVPHPCSPNIIWRGVGHKALLGGGAGNAFGKDFAANGYKWDSCLCNQDSDGDGRTNGDELGDPLCEWTPGTAPKHKFGLGHPGLCEPVHDPLCVEQNGFDVCETQTAEEFTCDALNSSDTESITIRFPPSPVPTKETSYVCQTFSLPEDREYHIVANQPVIDNEHVMHHIVLYGCDEGGEDGPVPITSAPEECGMAQTQCRELLALWAVGYNGMCNPDTYGVRIGVGGYKTVMMQAHWTNPTGRSDFTDSSGLILHYTPVLRSMSASIFHTGQYYLQIPPGYDNFPIDGQCQERCSSRLTEPIYISQVFQHMHYMGHSGYTELWRNGTKVADLVSSDNFDYDRPSMQIHDPPIEMLPGDTLKTRCVYNSRDQSEIIFWGDSTFQEMCVTFMVYYPDVDLLKCGTYNDLDACVLNNHTADKDSKDFPDCKSFFESPSNLANIGAVVKTCDPTGSTCRPGCADRIAVLRSDVCFQGDFALIFEQSIAKEDGKLSSFARQMHSCDTYEVLDGMEGPNDTKGGQGNNVPGGSARYDPEVNNIPEGGVCPFSAGTASRPISTTMLLIVPALYIFFKI